MQRENHGKPASARGAAVLIAVVLAAAGWWIVSSSESRKATPASGGGRSEARAEESGGALPRPPEAPDPDPVEVVREARAPVLLATPRAVEPDGGACPPDVICGVVLAGGGRPLAGAACSLYPSDAPLGLRFYRPVAERRPEPIASVRTDAAGAFELASAPGYWALAVEHPGWAPWREESVAAGSFRRVQLEHARELAFLVREEDGEPVPEARFLLLDNMFSHRASARAEARSDGAGRAVLTLPHAGEWFVDVTHPQYRSEGFDVVVAPGAVLPEREVVLAPGARVFGRVTDPRLGTAPAGAQVLFDAIGPQPTLAVDCDAAGRYETGPVFEPGGTAEVTARAPGYSEARVIAELPAEGASGGALELDFELERPEVRARGRVVDPDGRGLAGVDLFLKPFEKGPYRSARELVHLAVRWRPSGATGAGGAFELGGLTADRPYQLLAVPRRSFSNSLARIGAGEPGAVLELGEIVVSPGGRIYGRVLDAGDRPVNHLRVSLIPFVKLTLEQSRDPDYFPTALHTRLDDFTNRAGEFEFAQLPAGTFGLYWGERWTMDGEHHVGDFDVEPGREVGPLEVQLPAEEPQAPVAVAGNVVDAIGDPIGSVLVEAWRGPENPLSLGEGLLSADLTNAGGEFELALRPGRSYRVTATDMRGRFDTATTEIAPAGGDEALLFELQRRGAPPAPLAGVVSGTDGTALPGIEVTLLLSPLLQRCSCLTWEDTTDEAGRFSFGLVAEGQHQVAAVDPRGVHGSRVVPARPGEALSIVLER